MSDRNDCVRLHVYLLAGTSPCVQGACLDTVTYTYQCEARLEHRLLEAAGACDFAEASALLDGKADVNAVDGEGWSPLILAAKAGHGAMVDFLMERGAAPNPATVSHTALRAASIFGHEHIARRLLAARADPNLCSLFGRTPLMGAAMNKHPALVRVLLEARADAVARHRLSRLAPYQIAEAAGAPWLGRQEKTY